VLREEGIHPSEDAMTSTDLGRYRELIAEAHLILTMGVDRLRVTVSA